MPWGYLGSRLRADGDIRGAFEGHPSKQARLNGLFGAIRKGLLLLGASYRLDAEKGIGLLFVGSQASCHVFANFEINLLGYFWADAMTLREIAKKLFVHGGGMGRTCSAF